MCLLVLIFFLYFRLHSSLLAWKQKMWVNIFPRLIAAVISEAEVTCLFQRRALFYAQRSQLVSQPKQESEGCFLKGALQGDGGCCWRWMSSLMLSLRLAGHTFILDGKIKEQGRGDFNAVFGDNPSLFLEQFRRTGVIKPRSSWENNGSYLPFLMVPCLCRPC